MIHGIGCDIVEIERITKKQEQLAKRVLTKNEYEQYITYSDKRKLEYLAGKFAAKEAIYKAIGKGILSDYEILNDDRGKPSCMIENYTIHLSIAHENKYVIAYAICEE